MKKEEKKGEIVSKRDYLNILKSKGHFTFKCPIFVTL